MAPSLRIAIGLLLVLCTPVGQALTATSANSTGGAVDFKDGTTLVHPVNTTLGGSFDTAAWQIVDDVAGRSVRLPGNSDSLIVLDPRHETAEGVLGPGHFEITDFGQTATIVVYAAGSVRTTAVAASYELVAVDHEILEQSHAVGPQTFGGASPFPYYQYEVNEVIAWEADSPADIAIEGAFEVYVWDARVDYVAETGERQSWVTGQSYESEAGPSVPGNEDNHCRYFKLLTEGGKLQIVSPGSDVRSFADEVQTASSGTDFRGTSGQIESAEGTFHTQGPVNAAGGRYLVSYEAGGMNVEVLTSPTAVLGPGVTYVADPLHERSWFLPVLLGALFLLLVLAAGYSYPTFRGLAHVRTIESLTGIPRPRTWRLMRAEGFALMAANAEDAGHPRRAALLMVLATRLDPHDPEKALDAGIFLGAIGLHARALRLHKAAHAAFMASGEADNMAHNAFEAAKVLTDLGSLGQALDWLRIALQADPALVYEIGSDPRFSQLRNEPDYASITISGAT